MTSNNLKAIFFDAGNTLLRVHPSVGEIYAQAAKLHGAELSAETIEESFKKMWDKTAPLVSNEGHRLTYQKERDWWRFIVGEVFRDHMTFNDFEIFFDYLFDRFAQSECWRLYDDVQNVLDHLKRSGFRMAVISNWDSRLPALVDQLGISHYFESLTVSALVGYEKPHPAIFQIALQQAKLAPEEVLYIGDDPVLDYHAARKSGMHALHLDRAERFDPHPDKICSLAELLARIGH